ncbi:MAG TPA: 4'-phosphopantetheinyl transferase superfamily protein [Bacteroidales bacterium]|nr:4'-phosphopantetheinyl transferase superfamily protein [Bacteroidales bacterium]HPS15834.1 4'-phosphopantetheinyl transferase superfamily protein [Bacteroidales bacterium]
MGILFTRNINNATVGLWEITESVDVLFSKIKLNNEENELYNSFKNDTRKLHWLSYRNLLMELITPEEYSHVIYDDNGKPYLADNSHHLSVSHSGKFSAAVISKTKSVGIDIEIIHPKIEKVIHKYLSDEEIKNIGTTSRFEKLYIYWSAKESLYKLYGKRNLLFQENILIKPFIYSEKGEITGSIITEKMNQDFKLFYEKIHDYILVYTLAD